MNETSAVVNAGRRCRCGVGVLVLALVLLLLTGPTGCGRGDRELAPLTGKVLYNGEPLQFGAVMIEHEYGQPATAEIRPDGTFVMVTRGEGQGAVVGERRVRITCFEAQAPANIGSDTLGESLIPQKYTSFETSGLTVDIKPGENEPLVFELTDH
ncbi:MAG: hypothetical protein RBS80_17330 [Thermoguttaceae bacterium]|nr:hypothetical protein [Thermoguttaceae bacterium]